MKHRSLMLWGALLSLCACAPASHPQPSALKPKVTEAKTPASPAPSTPISAEKKAEIIKELSASVPDEPLTATEDTTFEKAAPPPPPPAPPPSPSTAVKGDPAKPSESFGAGGLGLSGIGEGGGGRGEGIGLGSVGVIGRGAGTGSGAGYGSGHGRLGGSTRSSPPKVRMGSVSVSGGGAGFGAAGGVAGGTVGGAASSGSMWGAADAGPRISGIQTGEWDDNANFREFVRWFATERVNEVPKFDLKARRFIVVRDRFGKAVPSCPVEIKDNLKASSVTLMTTATGRALFFPYVDGFGNTSLSATARCQGVEVSENLDSAPGDGVVSITLPGERLLPVTQTIDIAFVLDTTGSMSEEIIAMRDTLAKIANQLKSLNVKPRVGLVEYRDRGDEFVTRTTQMTTNLEGLSTRIAGLSANGGGDTPEHVNEAIRVAIDRLKWKPGSVARLVFLIGDAPPHLDYQGDSGYTDAVKQANHHGIQIYTIAASGMDRTGQVVFRQIAQLTGGTHMFVLRGGAGPQSSGAGDARSSCGGTHDNYRSGNLDELILSKVSSALAGLNSDPMRIAGLNKDENAKPCGQRVLASNP